MKTVEQTQQSPRNSNPPIVITVSQQLQRQNHQEPTALILVTVSPFVIVLLNYHKIKQLLYFAGHILKNGLLHILHAYPRHLLTQLLLLKLKVERSDNRVCVVNGKRSNISHLLNLLGTIFIMSACIQTTKCSIPNLHFLDLLVGHGQAELLNTALDGVPSSQSRGKVDVSAHTEIGRVDNLVGAGHVENSLGVNTSLVGEGAESGNGVVEGNVDLNGLGNHVLNLLELVQLVSGGDVVVAANNHAGEEATKRLYLVSEWSRSILPDMYSQ